MITDPLMKGRPSLGLLHFSPSKADCVGSAQSCQLLHAPPIVKHISYSSPKYRLLATLCVTG